MLNRNSSNFQIQVVNTDVQRKAFLDFPLKVYKNDPYWVQPLRRNTIKELAHNSPFRVYGQLQQFIAVYEVSGETLGRIVAAINQRLIEKEGETIGLFGYFECVETVSYTHQTLPTTPYV